MSGKTIRLYLVDGSPTSILTAEIINWTGKIIVAPRSQLAELARRDEAKRTGVYCLLGSDPDNPIRDIVYVGEGDNVLTRLTSHDRAESRDFWTKCAIVISKDQNLTKAHGRYLESRLIQLGKLADRATIANSTAPPLPPLPESDVADMEYFLDQLQIVFPVLGFGFLQQRPTFATSATNPSIEQSPLFEFSAVGAKASAREIGDEFIVLKGSTARKEGLRSWTSYKALRDLLVADGKLIESGEPNYYLFADDVPFNSPSAGAAVVNAGNQNGRIVWKVADTGETYQDWYDKKLSAAGLANEDNES